MSKNIIQTGDTIASIATPQGVGALGIIRISGKEAIQLCNQVFEGKNITKVSSHTLHYGYIKKGNKVIDEVMVSVFKAPKSYTKENMVEISCHGSPYIQQQILQVLIRKGARLATRGEFTMRAFLNGRLDLSQAEAVADLIYADNEGAHKLALHQMREGYSKQIETLRQQLIDFAALVELELDFSEEHVEFADKAKLKKTVKTILNVIGGLVDSFTLGNVVKNGVNTVIAGRPNAGKSTLMNALVNEEKAIVSDVPGTTRDALEEVINIDGIAYRLIDTAGIRDATDKIEAIGVQKTMQKIQQATILIYLFDASGLGLTELKKDLKNLERKGLIVMVVANKVDQLGLKKARGKYNALKQDVIYISSKEGTNLDKLKKQLTSLVNIGKVKPDQTVVTNARHYEALVKSKDALCAVLDGLSNSISGDLLALDIRNALHHLGLITGSIVPDDVLDSVFGRFCIGK